MSVEPRPSDPKSELEHALDETVDTITAHCVLRIHGKTMEARVISSAKQRWRDRYEKTFKEALGKGRHWKDDREQVLERACQVGYLAAYFATLRSIYEELHRAGIPLDPNEPPAQGQDIWLEPAYQPIVDSRIAEAASAFIDCDMNRGGDIRAQWIWCPSPPGAGVRDILGVALPRRMPTKDLQAITARIGKALAG